MWRRDRKHPAGLKAKRRGGLMAASRSCERGLGRSEVLTLAAFPTVGSNCRRTDSSPGRSPGPESATGTL